MRADSTFSIELVVSNTKLKCSKKEQNTLNSRTNTGKLLTWMIVPNTSYLRQLMIFKCTNLKRITKDTIYLNLLKVSNNTKRRLVLRAVISSLLRLMKVAMFGNYKLLGNSTIMNLLQKTANRIYLQYYIETIPHNLEISTKDLKF